MAEIKAAIAELPTYGYRRVHAILKRRALAAGRRPPQSQTDLSGDEGPQSLCFTITMQVGIQRQRDRFRIAIDQAQSALVIWAHGHLSNSPGPPR